MNEIPVTWKIALKVWWSLLWRGFLYSAFIAWPVIFVVVHVFAYSWCHLGGSSEALMQALTPLTYIVGTIIGVPVGIWVMKLTLNYPFSGFRIVIVKDDS